MWPWRRRSALVIADPCMLAQSHHFGLPRASSLVVILVVFLYWVAIFLLTPPTSSGPRKSLVLDTGKLKEGETCRMHKKIGTHTHMHTPSDTLANDCGSPPLTGQPSPPGDHTLCGHSPLSLNPRPQPWGRCSAGKASPSQLQGVGAMIRPRLIRSVSSLETFARIRLRRQPCKL